MFRRKERRAFGAAVVALSLLGCSNGQATTISGSYSFTASGFLADAPIYSYAAHSPPIAGQSPLLLPTFLNLSFGSTTFTLADTRRGNHANPQTQCQNTQGHSA
jgi:hypothetical protein